MCAWLWRAATLAAGLAVGWSLLAAPPPVNAAHELARANEYVQAGKPEAAIPIYRQLTAAFPAEPSFGINLAIAQYKAGAYRDALLECERLIKLQPELFPAWLFRGASYLKLGEAADAIEPLRKALAMHPDDRNARIMLADALLAVKRHAEAAEQYKLATQAMPDSARAWYGLQLCYESLAEQLLTRLRNATPASAEFFALSGDSNLDRGQTPSAFQDYRQALALRPAFRGLRAKVAEIYERTGHPDWAATERKRESDLAGAPCDGPTVQCEFVKEDLEAASAAQGESAELLYWRALALHVLSQRANAKLQQLAPARERYEAEAESNERSERYKDAAAAWKRALALADGDVEIQRRLALALCHSNDCAAALPVIQGLLTRSPGSAELNYLCGLALNSTQDPGKAIAYLETAVRLDRGFLPARAALGEAYLQAGDAARAIPHLEAAIREDETGSRRYQLARAYQSAGKLEQAREILREYREIQSRRAKEAQREPRITPP